MTKPAVDQHASNNDSTDDLKNIRFICKYAICSRIFVTIVTILTNYSALDYDASTPLLTSDDESCKSDPILPLCLPFIHWDAGMILDLTL